MNTISINSIAEAHQLLGLGKPQHPLITIYYHTPDVISRTSNASFTGNLYYIAMKENSKGAFEYGRNTYDFEEGSLMFLAPNQVYTTPEKIETEMDGKGWSLLFHPDLIRKFSLGATINTYTFFNYEVNEALHLSDKELRSINELIYKIEEEINQNIDKHSQELININLESLLKYSKRYYERQFYTRTSWNKDYIVRFENYLQGYFSSNQLIDKGIPSVKQCGEALNMSGHYLSDLLKAETGKSAKEHLNLHLIEKAKLLLSTSSNSISEVAYALGFSYPQNFSKLFKSKTGVSPSEYRNLN
ncbi:MAG: helix-turn-helix transcriptional regulator [Bacteroidota bacterium]